MQGDNALVSYQAGVLNDSMHVAWNAPPSAWRAVLPKKVGSRV
jgi:hypothetical protein